MTTVVPDYRCGAVPDSHRVPSSPLPCSKGTDAVAHKIVKCLSHVKQAADYHPSRPCPTDGEGRHQSVSVIKSSLSAGLR
jgi:hypothetical protein